VLLIPGLLIGSALKGASYLSDSIKQQHNWIVQHYTPVDRIVGSEEKRLDLTAIKERLEELAQHNPLAQPTKNLVIYAKDGTIISDDPGILKLKPLLKICTNLHMTE
jgi:hypothetical protein